MFFVFSFVMLSIFHWSMFSCSFIFPLPCASESQPWLWGSLSQPPGPPCGCFFVGLTSSLRVPHGRTQTHQLERSGRCTDQFLYPRTSSACNHTFGGKRGLTKQVSSPRRDKVRRCYDQERRKQELVRSTLCKNTHLSASLSGCSLDGPSSHFDS